MTENIDEGDAIGRGEEDVAPSLHADSSAIHRGVSASGEARVSATSRVTACLVHSTESLSLCRGTGHSVRPGRSHGQGIMHAVKWM
jgi:hypothetical protein